MRLHRIEYACVSSLSKDPQWRTMMKSPANGSLTSKEELSIILNIHQKGVCALTCKGFWSMHTLWKEPHATAERNTQAVLSQMPFWEAMLLCLLKIECSLNSRGSHSALRHSSCEPSAVAAWFGRRSKCSHYHSDTWCAELSTLGTFFCLSINIHANHISPYIMCYVFL